jgi:hypothetical protein
MEKINIKPNWKETMRILILLIESGTKQGKDDAKKTLFEIANFLDENEKQTNN